MIDNLHSIFLESQGVCTDSRKLLAGEIFFALKGTNFNGNDFAEKALQLGAKAVIVDEEIQNLQENPSVFFVKNTLETLQELAAHHREKWGKDIIAITGSNGKTTTKELLNSILSQEKKIHSTTGNLNNHVGVPLSLLQLKPEHELAIIEMGSNQPGDIADLCFITRPNFGLITNISETHLLGLRDKEGVYKEKSNLFSAVKFREGINFINEDDDFISSDYIYPEDIVYNKYGNSDFMLKPIVSSCPYLKVIINDTEIQTKLVGEYNLPNIAAAVAVAKYFSLTDQQIKVGLEQYIPTNKRSQLIEKDNKKIVVDCYNANFESMNQSIQSFIQLFDKDKALLVIGDMLELGNSSDKFHKQILQLLKKNKIDHVCLVGENFSKALDSFNYVDQNEKTKSYTQSIQPNDKLNYHCYSNVDNLIANIENEKDPEIINYFLKGSRSIGLEKVLEVI